MYKTNSIRKKFLLIFGVSLSSLFILLMTSNYFLTNKNFNNIEEKYKKNIANSFENNLSLELENIEESLLTISDDGSLLIYNETKKESVLDYFLLKFINYTSIISLLDEKGNEIKRQRDGKEVDIHLGINSNPLYSQSLKNPNEIIKSEIKYKDDLKTYVIEFMLHKTNYFDDEFVATIFGVIEVDPLFKKILPHDKELQIRIVDKNNNIVFSSEEKEMLKKIDLSEIKKDKLSRITISDEHTITYSHFIMNNSLILLVSKNLDAFMSELYSLLITGIVIFLIIIISVMIFIYFYVERNIHKPIESLMKNIFLISKGEYSHEININTNDEIEILGERFNDMNKNLQNSLLKIEEKEKDLKNVNYKLSKLVLEQEEKINKQIHEIMEKDKLVLEKTKMASLGEMLKNIAHQWRQPLSVISASVSGLQVIKSCGALDEAELDKTLDGILKNTIYLSETINYFRNFVKNDDSAILFNPDENLYKNLSILENSFKLSKINVVLNLNADFNIKNYANDLTQVFMNIVNNSKDALELNKIKDKYIFISTEIKDGELIIKIKDNAEGISPNILEKIFEPYFTTKHESQGTGLGLYMSYKIVTERMKGEIFAQNVTFNYGKKEFNGAEFTLVIPIEL